LSSPDRAQPPALGIRQLGTADKPNQQHRKTDMTNKAKTLQKEIKTLELQIELNQMLPSSRQCKDAIAKMRAKLAHLRRQGELRAVT
jgi:hypothetical protein